MTENDIPPTTDDEIEPIPAAEARRILENAIRERLGDKWRDEETGWQIVTGHDYMARLTRGTKNLDFYVDLLGNVTVEEKEIDGGQSNGRLIAWMVLIASLILAFFLAQIAGLLN
jgi:hypothetical protein